MTTVFDLMAKISLDSREYDDGLNEAGGKLQGFGSKAGSVLSTVGKVGTAAIGVAAAGISAIIKQSVDGYANYEQLVGGVETLYKDSAEKVQNYANEAYKTAGMSANDYMETATSFAAALINSLGGDTDKAAEMANMAVTDMSDNVNKMGSSVESVQNAYNGFAKGNFTMLDNLKLGYGGTKEEMERLLERAEEIKKAQGETADYSISSYADIVEAIHVVQDEMGITGTTSREASETISGSLASAKAAWDNLVVSFSTGNGDIAEKSKIFADSAITVIHNVIPRIKEALAGIGAFVDEAVPVILGELPGLVEEILPDLLLTAANLVARIVEALPEILSALVNVASSVVDSISAALNEKYPVLGEAFDTIVGAVKTAFDTIVDFWNTTLKPALDDIWAFMTETLAPEISDVWTTIIQPSITTVMDVISTTWESVLKPALEAIWTFIKDTLAPAVKTAWEDTIKPAITGVIDTVKDKWENVLKPALEKFQTFLDETLVPAVKKAWEENIQPAITTVMEKVSDVWNNILKPVFTAIRDFVVDTLAPIIKDRWENVIKPAIAGIMEHIGWVWETILSPALSALYDFVVDKVVPAAESFGEKFEWLNDTILSPLATFLKDVFLSALRGVRNFVETYVLPTVKRIGEKLQTFHDTVISPLSDFIDDNVVPAFEGFSGVLDDLYGFLEPVGDFVQNVLIGAFEGAKAIVDTVISTIVSAIEWAENALEKIRAFREANAQAQSEYDNYVSNQVSQGTYYGPGFAKGGSLRSGSVWVGEEAPEILTVHNGIATVTPVKGSGRHTPVSSNVTFNVYAQPGQDEVAIAREVQKQFLRWDKQERAAMG